ncbi:unnamed protein product [Lactuca saligna]|uniref:Uncharacterized protein n=1 Tax=Lactuca saligna TaxID=75948 RepID=A0AA36EMN7_LACSI|nr:unnamed protein product [Lactuca saligna]
MLRGRGLCGFNITSAERADWISEVDAELHGVSNASTDEAVGSHNSVRGKVDAELRGESNASAEWVVGADFEEFFDTKVSFSYISNGINTYVRPKLNNLGLLLPPNFDCRILFDLVKSKAKVFNTNISLSFQHPVHGYVMNILDEADVHQLRNVIYETQEIVHLYLEVFQGLVEQTKVAEKVVSYNVENIVSDNIEDCP